jgi:hypothetical protein
LIKKLSFTIENAEMIRENPESKFALLALDFFASGDNLHDMYVSEETLMRTADTIKGCPLVWKYDSVLDDIYTHDPDEVPCGFVPESTTITSKKLEDGRTMLSAIAYVWKRYTGPLLSFFKRDGGKKPVSVEMSVYKTQSKEDGKTELLDFRYEGVTVLGSYVTPAIPMANASVLSFAKEYEEDLEKEFSFTEIIIPKEVRYSVEKGFEIKKEEGGGTSTGIAFARYLSKNKIITPDKVREINNYFSTHKNSKQTVDWLLFGGDYGKKWAEEMVEKMDKEIVTFPYKSKADINPALKGIEPPVSLAQANAIANQADTIGSDKEKNGWAIAISSFKKTHHVEDGKWVKNKGSTAKAAAGEEYISDLKDWEYWEEVVEEDFAAEDMGKGEAIQVNKSKDAVSNTAWGSVDKTSLMHKVLKASNYKSLVHDVYLVVDSGWEEHPSSSLHYPVMQIVDGKAVYNRGGLTSALGRAQGQNETGVVSKVNGLYKKLGLGESTTEKASTDDIEDFVKEETMTEEEKMAAEKAEADVKMAAEEEAKMAAEEEAKMAAEKAEADAKMAAEEEAKAKMAADSKVAAEKAVAEKMAADEAKAKAAEEAKKKLEEEKSKKFEFPIEKCGEMFSADDDEDDVKMAKAECAKGKEADFGIVMNGLFAKIEKLCNKMAMMAEEKKAYMAENEELKKFKAELEGQQKEFAINETLKELSASVYLPDDVKAEMRADAANYTLANMEAWKNSCKAKSFDFAIRMPQNKGTIEVGLPFGGSTKKQKSLWD